MSYLSYSCSAAMKLRYRIFSNWSLRTISLPGYPEGDEEIFIAPAPQSGHAPSGTRYESNASSASRPFVHSARSARSNASTAVSTPISGGGSGEMPTCGRVARRVQRYAKVSVPELSSNSLALGCTAATSAVRLLPCSAVRSNFVSAHSRKGAKRRSASACTQRPSAVSDALMQFASRRRTPSARERATRSEPARSASVSSALAPPTVLTCTNASTWLRLLFAFMRVEPVARRADAAPRYPSSSATLSALRRCISTFVSRK